MVEAADGSAHGGAESQSPADEAEEAEFDDAPHSAVARGASATAAEGRPSACAPSDSLMPAKCAAGGLAGDGGSSSGSRQFWRQPCTAAQDGLDHGPSAAHSTAFADIASHQVRDPPSPPTQTCNPAAHLSRFMPPVADRTDACRVPQCRCPVK